MKALNADTVAGVIIVDARSWCTLHLGPAMPVAWHDNTGAGAKLDSAL